MPEDNIHSFVTGQTNDDEGFYVSNFIVGFAERGQMVTGETPDTNFVPVNPTPEKLIPSGDYTLQIRRGPSYGIIHYPPKFIPPPYRKLALSDSWDTNARFSDSISLVAPAGGDIPPGQTFTISDDVTTLRFQFVLQGTQVTSGDVAIGYSGLETASQIAGDMVTAINDEYSADDFKVCSSSNNPPQVDLFNAVSTSWPQSDIWDADPLDGIPATKVPGDRRSVEVQGEVLINADMVTDCPSGESRSCRARATREPTSRTRGRSPILP